MAGVNPTQTSKITAALSTAGIPYQLANNGTAIQVQSSDEAQARVTLASGGLLTGAGGDATLEGSSSSSSLGESNFQQQLQYQSALESQLDQGIEQFGGINSAQVSIVLPDPTDELFTTSQTPSSASVIVNDDGDMSADTAKSIAQYIKDSVAALQLSNITITDQKRCAALADQWQLHQLRAALQGAGAGRVRRPDDRRRQCDARFDARRGQGLRVDQLRSEHEQDIAQVRSSTATRARR